MIYESEIMVWKEIERSSISSVQMDNFRALIGVRRINRMGNERIRKLIGARKGVNKIMSMMRWYWHIIIMRIRYRTVLESEREGVRRVGKPHKKHIS